MEDICSLLDNHMDKLVVVAFLFIFVIGNMDNIESVANDPLVLCSAILCGVYVNYTTSNMKVAVSASLLVILLTAMITPFPVVQENLEVDDNEEEPANRCKDFGNPENLYGENNEVQAAVRDEEGDLANKNGLQFWGNVDACCSSENEEGMTDNQKAACAIAGKISDVSSEVINNFVKAATPQNSEPCPVNSFEGSGVVPELMVEDSVEGYEHTNWENKEN